MFNLKFLGTGSIDTPRPRNKLSKDYRRFATLLIDDRILIDPAEDIFEFENTFMLQGMLREVKDIFITHSHIDRFSPLALERLARAGGVRIYASPRLESEIRCISGAEYIRLEPLSIIRLPSHSVMPLPANHRTDDTHEIPFNLLVNKGEDNLFYGLDGGFINPCAWQVLSRVKLTCAILDCQRGNEALSGSCADHNNLELCVMIHRIMTEAGVADERTKFILSSLPTSKKCSYHEELCEAVADLPFRIAYDGYFVSV